MKKRSMRGARIAGKWHPFKIFVCLLSLLFCTACNQDSDAAADLAMSDATVASDGARSSDQAMCATTCPPCAGDEVCAAPNGILDTFEATCLKRCNVTGDCAAGMRCALFLGDPQTGPFCTSSDVPRACAASSAFDCDLAGAFCRDANVLEVPYQSPANQTCGWEQVACANSCAPLTPDGGVPGMVPSHCQ